MNDAPTPKSRFHHYVPKFYLANWSTSVGVLPKRIWIYQKDSAPRHAAIKNTGGRKGMYELRDLPGLTDPEEVEKKLGKLEGRLGTILPKIIEKKILTVAEYSAFCYFLSIFYRRTPYVTDRLGPKFVKPEFEKQNREWRQRIDTIDDDKLRELELGVYSTIEKLSTDNFSTMYAMALFFEADEVARFICEQLTGAFFYSENRHFVTSDNPITFNHGVGLSNPHSYLVFPVSRKVAFVAGRFIRSPLTYTKIPGHLVDFLNERIISCAYREVFADGNDTSIRSMVNASIGSELTHK